MKTLIFLFFSFQLVSSAIVTQTEQVDNAKPFITIIPTKEDKNQTTLLSKLTATKQKEETAQVVKESSSQQDRDLHIQKKSSICNMSFIKMMLNQPDLPDKADAIITTKYNKENCPDMKKSCCDQKQTKYLFEEVKQSFSYYQTAMKEMKSFVSFISTITDERLQNFKAKRGLEIRKCDSDTSKFIDLIKKIRAESLQLHDSYIDHLRRSIENKFGLVCGLCAYKNNNFFSIMPEKPQVYQMSLQSPEEIYYEFSTNLNLFKLTDIAKLKVFIRCYYFQLVRDENESTVELDEKIVRIVERQEYTKISHQTDLIEFFTDNFVLGSTRFVDFKILETLLTEIIDEDDHSVSDFQSLFYTRNIFIDEKEESVYKPLVPENISVKFKKIGFISLDNRFTGKSYLKEFDDTIKFQKSSTVLSVLTGFFVFLLL